MKWLLLLLIAICALGVGAQFGADEAMLLHDGGADAYDDAGEAADGGSDDVYGDQAMDLLLPGDELVEQARDHLEELRFVDRDGREWNALVQQTRDKLEQAFALANEQAALELGLLYLFGDLIERDMERARTYFEFAAQTGSPQSMVMLGFMYAQGWGVAPDMAKALAYYRVAAQESSSEAQMILGHRYLHGYGVVPNCMQALQYYREAANQAALWLQEGHADLDDRQMLSEGVELATSEVVQENVRFYELAAEYGDPGANAYIGNLHLHGMYGYRQDFEQARIHLERAAEAGDPHAHGQLGAMHHNGMGVVASNETAQRYFERGVDLNDLHSMNGLAAIKVANGHAVAGFQLFKMAADLGDPEGQLRLGTCYLQGVGTKTNYNEALKYFTMAAKNEHHMANYYLGAMFENGYGTASSCEIAVQHYRVAAQHGPLVSLAAAFESYERQRYMAAAMLYAFDAELGEPTAMHNAAYVLDHVVKSEPVGVDVEDLSRKAFAMWKRAAAENDVEAIIMMADRLYYNGVLPDSIWAAWHAAESTPVEVLAKAFDLYSTAALTFHSPRALYNIAYMYQYGIAVPQDFELAVRYYREAIERHIDAWLPSMLGLAVAHVERYLSFVFSWRGIVPQRPSSLHTGNLVAPQTSDGAGDVPGGARRKVSASARRVASGGGGSSGSPPNAEAMDEILDWLLWFFVAVLLLMVWRRMQLARGDPRAAHVDANNINVNNNNNDRLAAEHLRP